MVTSRRDIPSEDERRRTRFLRRLESTGDFLPGSLPPDEPFPERIGRYRILQRLGRGGMGDVFLAYDESLSRQVALKRIRADRFPAWELQQRFEIEARVTSMLQHPAIVPVYQFERGGGEMFYTMRPVEGVTLGEIIFRLRKDAAGARDEWPAARLVRLFLQAANAVAYAHSRGVIHRDLKPDNIMIGPFEEVLVLDWGMAKVLEGEEGEGPQTSPPGAFPGMSAETAPHSVVGTPPYMAPQQLRGAPATVASDVFSLGVTLYELLTLQLPWYGENLTALYQARKRAPEPPVRFKSARGIPHDLSRAVLRALEFDPAARFPSVATLVKEAADALEGRAAWRLEERSRERTNWSFTGGQLREDNGELALRSGGLMRYFCLLPLPENVSVEFEVSMRKGQHDLSVWLHTPDPRIGSGSVGYNLMVLSGKRRSLSLLRCGRVVAGARSPAYEAGRWYRITAAREDDRFSLAVDGEEIYVYHDPIPLRSGFVGLTAQSGGLRIRDLRVHSRGTGATVSCLAVPDAFFNRRLYIQARGEYEAIASSQAGRSEGKLAGFRAGLCLLELAEEEKDEETRWLLLDEARGAFARLSGPNDTCLAALGQAMVADARGNAAAKHVAMARAFQDYPGDPHLPAVREWLMGRLHASGAAHRPVIAELLPLAIAHCMDGWGRRVVSNLMRDVRAEWEIPSFLTSRRKFRSGDPACHAEAKLFFAFWAGREQLIEQAAAELLAGRRFRPYHLADAVFALLEMGNIARARGLLDRLDGPLRKLSDPRRDRVRGLCRAAVLAAEGDRDASDAVFSTIEPDPSDRIYNSTRLVRARSCFALGEPGHGFRALRPLGQQERFAREYQAWFCLREGDVKGADRQLQLLVERDDHKKGRNLVNFLHGVSLIFQGRTEKARAVFSYLPEISWPRTWTLGSHYALGRLGGGAVDAYVRDAFPYERRCLRAHAELLALARGEGIESLPESLRAETG